MFLRFSYVVGHTGILFTLVILAASKAITILTSLSLSAISTNTRVKGGGAYYLISRSLGVEFGDTESRRLLPLFSLRPHPVPFCITVLSLFFGVVNTGDRSYTFE